MHHPGIREARLCTPGYMQGMYTPGIYHPICSQIHLVHTPAGRHPLLPWCTPRPCVGDEALGSVWEKPMGREASQPLGPQECDGC